METTRTIMLKPTEADYEEILQLCSNEQVRQYLGGPVQKVEFDEKFKGILCAKSPETYWVVRQKETKACIGLVSITKYHDQIHFEVSYELYPRFWGNGYGTEIAERVIAYSFNFLELEELYAETQKKNLASIKLLENIGMQSVACIERFGEEQVVYLIRKQA